MIDIFQPGIGIFGQHLRGLLMDRAESWYGLAAHEGVLVCPVHAPHVAVRDRLGAPCSGAFEEIGPDLLDALEKRLLPGHAVAFGGWIFKEEPVDFGEDLLFCPVIEPNQALGLGITERALGWHLWPPGRAAPPRGPPGRLVGPL